MPQANHDHGQQIIILFPFRHLAYQILFLNGVSGDRVLPPLRWIGTDPYGIDLSYILVMSFCKFWTILRRDHPAAIIKSPFDDRITRIKIILCFHIDHQTNCFPGSWNDCQKTDIIGDRPFLYRTVLILHSLDLFSAVACLFIRIDCCLCNLRDSFYVFFRYLMNAVSFILFQTALHDPGQNDLIGQKPFARCIISGLFTSHCNIFCQCILNFHKTGSSYCFYISISASDKLYFLMKQIQKERLPPIIVWMSLPMHPLSFSFRFHTSHSLFL